MSTGSPARTVPDAGAADSGATSPRVQAIVAIEGGTAWLRASAPAAWLIAREPGDVGPVLREVERLARTRGWYVVGWMAYEAGAAYGLRTKTPSQAPLACFAAFDNRHVTIDDHPPSGGTWVADPPAASMNLPAYGEAVARVRREITEGNTYQVNLTFGLSAAFSGDPRGLFADLSATQRGRYSMFLHTDARAICSASPELFLSRRGRGLISRPMKGTAPRGRTVDEDLRFAERLRASEKERAENVMIVDMVRNDLGRVARTGSVDVTALFGAERYPTVWQMTSEVRAESAAPLDQILAATFPAASITGAPKARTMEIIDGLESSPRGLYTGIAGYVAPGGDFQFNVAIRTAVVDQAAGHLTFGVGSGVTWDSDAKAEYDECLLKARVLGARGAPFELLETLRWDRDGGYHRRAAHIARMESSASYFDFRCERPDIEQALDTAVVSGGDRQRVRLLLAEDGAVRTESFVLAPDQPSMRACLASTPIDDADPLFFHKTTSRGGYEARRCDSCDDVLLWNPRGELTESTLANIVVELDGELFTPPVECGLLAGTERAHALAAGRIRERVIEVAELSRVTRLWLINSVRGWREVVVIGHDAGPDGSGAPGLTRPEV